VLICVDRTVVTQDGDRVTLQPLSSTTFSWRKQQFRVGQGAFVWTTPLERTTNHQPLCRSVIRIAGFWMDPLSGQRWVGGHTMYHHTDSRFHQVVHSGLLMQARASASASASHDQRTKAKAKWRRATKSEDESESEDLEEGDSEVSVDDENYVDVGKNEDDGEDEDEQEDEDEEDNEDDEYDRGEEEEEDEDDEEEERRGGEGEESEGAIQLLFHVNELFDSTDVEYYPMAMLYEPCRIDYIYVAPSPYSDEEDRDLEADNEQNEENEDDDNNKDDDEEEKESDEGNGLEGRRRSRMRKRSAMLPQIDAERKLKKRRRQGRSNSRFQRDRRAVCKRINNELAARYRDARRRPPATAVDEPGCTFFCAERFNHETTELERLSEEQVQRLQLGARGVKAKPDLMEVDDDCLPDRGRKTDDDEEEKKMSAFDLFCGCGGMSIGLQMAGVDVKWAVGTSFFRMTRQRTTHNHLFLSSSSSSSLLLLLFNTDNDAHCIETYRRAHPEARVYHRDAWDILHAMKEGLDDTLPKPGEVLILSLLLSCLMESHKSL
jgi:hypothetical protein